MRKTHIFILGLLLGSLPVPALGTPGADAQGNSAAVSSDRLQTTGNHSSATLANAPDSPGANREADVDEETGEPGQADWPDVSGDWSLQPLGLIFGMGTLEWENKLTDFSTLAVRLIGGMDMFTHDRILGGGLRYRFYPTDERIPSGYFVGPAVEYLYAWLSQPDSMTVWSAGCELGYRFLWKQNYTWVVAISGEWMLTHNQYYSALPRTNFYYGRLGVNIGVGIAF
jgi:hypothetical protein